MIIKNLEKKMLRIFETVQELCEALELTTGSVYLLPIHYCIRHEVLNIFPEAKCVVFAYPEQSPRFWMVIRRNMYTRLVNLLRLLIVLHYWLIQIGCIRYK